VLAARGASNNAAVYAQYLFQYVNRLDSPLESLPDRVEAALRLEPQIARDVARYVHAPECIVLGRAFQYSTAREMALKLEETCYLIATPFSTADFRHGPTALAERGLPVFVFVARDALDMLTWLRDQHADTVVVSEDNCLLDLATTPIRLNLPSSPSEAAELLSPIASIAPHQGSSLPSTWRSNVDWTRPARSLTKVTRTR